MAGTIALCLRTKCLQRIRSRGEMTMVRCGGTNRGWGVFNFKESADCIQRYLVVVSTLRNPLWYRPHRDLVLGRQSPRQFVSYYPSTPCISVVLVSFAFAFWSASFSFCVLSYPSSTLYLVTDRPSFKLVWSKCTIAIMLHTGCFIYSMTFLIPPTIRTHVWWLFINFATAPIILAPLFFFWNKCKINFPWIVTRTAEARNWIFHFPVDRSR